MTLLTQIFNTTKQWKELKFNAHKPEIFMVGEDTVIPSSVFIATQSTVYPDSVFTTCEVKLKARKVEERDSWTAMGSYVEYRWNSEADAHAEDISLLPAWLHEIVYADNSGN